MTTSPSESCAEVLPVDLLRAEIEERLGFLPAFFFPILEMPDVLENLWRQTLSAYVNTPLPPLFKERLFAYLSRYCTVPYSIVCHSCALRSLGMTASQVLHLLQQPAPAPEDLEGHLRLLVRQPELAEPWPQPGTPPDQALFACSSTVFLGVGLADRCRAGMRRYLGPRLYTHWVALLAYIKTCHTWVEAHPEIAYEADERARRHLAGLLQAEPQLRDYFQSYVETTRSEQAGREEKLLAEIAMRKQAEQELRGEAERIQEQAQHLLDLTHVLVRDFDGRITLWNTEAARMYGWTAEEALGRVNHELLQTVFPYPLEQIEADLLRNGRWEGELMHTRRDGSQLIVASYWTLHRDRRNKPLAVLEVNNDITTLKRAEEAWRESEQRFTRFMQHLQGLAWIKDLEGHYVYANDAAEKVFGTPRAELYGKTDEEVFPTNTVATFRESDLQALASGTGVQVIETLVHKDGVKHYSVVNKFPIPGPDGRPALVGGVAFDITDRLRAEEALQQVNVQLQAEIVERRRVEEEVRRLNAGLEERVRDRTAELEAANKELEAFSYSVSHDLRAPLRAIDGFSRHLLKHHAEGFSAEAREYFDLIRDNTRQMGQLVDDLLAFSRLGRQPINKQVVQPNQLVCQCLDGLRGEHEGRQVEVVVGDLPPCRAEPSLLKQVWTNLLSNAYKYTRKRDAARVEVGCCLTNAGETVYFVKDNGVGFDMRYVNRLFGVFQRLHRAEDYEGTGVGLAIVQRIVHRHGGQVWVEAKPDEGATFYFTLGKGGAHD